MKLIDGFGFYNELGLLKYRLDTLYDIVDNFILVEATTTYMGNLKELFYEKNKHLYEKYQDKIIHIIVDDMPDASDPWKPENHQRRCISRGLQNLNLQDEDLILVSDLDEIPNPKILSELKITGCKSMFSLNQDLYYYNLTNLVNNSWVHPKIFSYSFYKNTLKYDTNSCRLMNVPILNNGGWHLSYFGDSSFISNKIKNFAHKEYNSEEYTDKLKIEERIRRNVAVFNDNIILKNIPIDQNQNLPPNHEFLLECLSINS